MGKPRKDQSLNPQRWSARTTPAVAVAAVPARWHISLLYATPPVPNPYANPSASVIEPTKIISRTITNAVDFEPIPTSLHTQYINAKKNWYVQNGVPVRLAGKQKMKVIARKVALRMSSLPAVYRTMVDEGGDLWWAHNEGH